MSTIFGAPAEIPLPATMLPVHWSLADVQEHLGGIPNERIRSYPPPGMATEDDALAVHQQGGALCELIDGTLVEKAVGYHESLLAVFLLTELQVFLNQNALGILLGPDGPLRLKGGNLRMPDISFLRWEHFPHRKIPDTRVLLVAPDLAVEVLSKGNTKREMERKIQDLFASGTQEVWLIDGKRRLAEIYSTPQNFRTITGEQNLESPVLLPGFRLRLGDLFDRLPPLES